MLERFLKTSKAVARLRAGAFGPFLDSYVEHVVGLGYCFATIREQLWTLDALQRWMKRKKLSVGDLNQELACGFVETRRSRNRRRRLSRLSRCEAVALRLLLNHLRDLGAVAVGTPAEDNSAVAQLEHRFRVYLKRERGLAPRTLDGYLPYVRRFLNERFRNEPCDPSSLTSSDVSGFVLRHARSMGPRTAQSMGSALRSFFRFLLQHGEIGIDLAAAVPTVADWRLARVPQFLSPNEVRSMLNACNRDTPVGRRDYAILVVLARLGLRATEVLALRLEDIDWRAGEVTIRGKGQVHDRLPLPQDVGEAIVDYLQHGRPDCAAPEVFVRTRAPHRGLGNPSTVSTLVRRALQRGDLHPSSRGAHLLRNTLATTMLRGGASISEIGQVLRHRSAATTELYVKVDIEGLRMLAQPWPVDGGAQ